MILGVGALPSMLLADDSDNLIYDRVHRRLNNDRELKIGDLRVEVADGVVTVDGYVRSKKLQAKVAKVAKKTKGVKQVINRVRVRL